MIFCCICKAWGQTACSLEMRACFVCMGKLHLKAESVCKSSSCDFLRAKHVISELSHSKRVKLERYRLVSILEPSYDDPWTCVGDHGDSARRSVDNGIGVGVRGLVLGFRT